METIYVALLTEQQKAQLVGQMYAPDSYFNPVQDINNNWVISQQEQEYNENPNFNWIEDLPLIPWEPKPSPGPGFIF